jgi:3-oxoadipate enol-lactonase
MPKKQIRDITMHYEISGKGPNLVFIHGLGSSTRDWEFQTEYFYKNYRVITLDLRGHGQTDKPQGPYSIELFANDVASLLKSIDAAPAHVIGLSMGGAVTFHLCTDHPEVVKTACITNMSAAMPVKTFAQKRMYYMRYLIVHLLGMRKMGEVIASKVFLKPHQQSLRDMLKERWAENSKKQYLASLAALKNWSVMDRLYMISCPVLIVHSEFDYTPREHKEEYTAIIPNAEFVIIPDSGHVVNVEKPGTYNEIVSNFLSTKNQTI